MTHLGPSSPDRPSPSPAAASPAADRGHPTNPAAAAAAAAAAGPSRCRPHPRRAHRTVLLPAAFAADRTLRHRHHLPCHRLYARCCRRRRGTAPRCLLHRRGLRCGLPCLWSRWSAVAAAAAAASGETARRRRRWRGAVRHPRPGWRRRRRTIAPRSSGRAPSLAASRTAPPPPACACTRVCACVVYQCSCQRAEWLCAAWIGDR
jgi:hypothetical protein